MYVSLIILVKPEVKYGRYKDSMSAPRAKSKQDVINNVKRSAQASKMMWQNYLVEKGEEDEGEIWSKHIFEDK